MATDPAAYKTQTTEAYDALAAELVPGFDRHFEASARREAKRFLRGLRKDALVLDLGCGGGVASAYFCQRGFSTVSADLSGEMVQECRRRGLENVVQVDLEDLPFCPRAFDAVWAHTSLIHVPKERLARALAGVARVLKPGGTLFVALKEGGSQGYEGQPGTERWFSNYGADEFEQYLPPDLRVVQRSRTDRTHVAFLNFHLRKQTVGRDDIQWPRRVPKHKVRRLYESDARGMLDTDLVDDVGITLLLRCKAILEVAEAREGRVRCPRCARKRRESVIARARDTRDTRDELLTCPTCGWQITWGEYVRSFKRRQLNSGGAAEAFAGYVERYGSARTPQAKMLAIDRLIHEFHFSFQDKPWLPTRSVGPNLIQGKLGDILTFLDELTYGPDAAQEMREQREAWQRNLETNQRYWLGESQDRNAGAQGKKEHQDTEAQARGGKGEEEKGEKG